MIVKEYSHILQGLLILMLLSSDISGCSFKMCSCYILSPDFRGFSPSGKYARSSYFNYLMIFNTHTAASD